MSPGLNPNAPLLWWVVADAGPQPRHPLFHGGSSPVGSGFDCGGKLSSDSEASYGSEPCSPPPEGKGKAVAVDAGHRRRPRRRRARNLDGFMVVARRSHPRLDTHPQASYPQQPVVVERCLPSPMAHPARASGMPDAQGFHQVQSHHRWCRCTPPKQSKPLPANLVGKCFNCMGEDHVKANCIYRSWCLNSRSDGRS